MLEILNRYAHGYTLVAAIRACRGVTAFREPGEFSWGDLVRGSGANPGVLRVILRQFESLGILRRANAGNFRITDYSLLSAGIPEEVLHSYRLRPAEFLTGEGAVHRLRPWVDRMLERRGSGDLGADLLDGPMMVPVLLGLSPRVTPDGTIDVAGLGVGVLPEVERLLAGKGFGGSETGQFRLNASGRYLFERAPILATVYSYGPMLARVEDLLFGNPGEVFARNADGHETHVDRHLNVTGSGFQHEKFFAHLDGIVREIFSDCPMHRQPRYVADMGCGDGTLLRRVYKTASESTPRGAALGQYPLTMIGLDFNQQALDQTGRTLAGIPHLLLRADIGKPAEIADEFARLGIDADEVLHIRSFLDHDRPYVRPANSARAALRSRIPNEGVSVDADGNWIPPGEVVESLVQHLENWAAVVNRHGLVLLEVHCLAPAMVRRFLDESESLHFDAYHGFSRQHLVEAHVFRLALAEAGLFARAGFSRRFPRTLPYTRITLDWLETRPYRVRHALPADVPYLCGLESVCWAPALRISEGEIRDRLERFPEGQFVLERGGRVAAVLYSQRIRSIEALEHARFADIRALHDEEGPVLQLLGLNVNPEPGNQTLGSQLADVVIDWCRLRGDIEAVAGITRCREFPQAGAGVGFAEYVRRIDGGLPVDPILRFHASRGARIRAVVENFRPEDRDNLGNGVLIEYDIGKETQAGSKQAVLSQTGSIEAAVVSCVERLVAGNGRAGGHCSAETPLRETGLDSLDLMELRGLLNRQFGAALDASFFFEYATPKAIAAYLEGRSTERAPQAREGAAIPETEALKTQASETQAPADAVAIVGMSCRFPGADGSEAFWDLMERGESACGPVPATRWKAERGDAPGAEFGGFLRDVDQFDAGFFRISPREAQYLDPQHRILLEESWRALESAGIDPGSLRGSRTGVFMGIFSHDYENLSRRLGAEAQPYLATGNAAATASGRVAYFFDLRGPALSIDTACSSSLVAMHLACQSLRGGESTVALVGAVNLMLTPELSAAFAASGMLARDGRCKTFDAAADGYVRSEGCAVVVLKLLRKALAEGDEVLAVVRGTAVNQDGESNGLTAPNGRAQEDVIRAALAAAGCGAREVSFVEAHGTGTALGDPVEVKALGRVYGEERDAVYPLTLGSVKTNIGHTEAAAGLAGLLKVVLALRRRRIPRHLHFSRLNGEIALDGIPARIATEAMEWKPGVSGRRLAGISSFGFSGTNAHAIIEEAPPVAPIASPEPGWQILALSAGSIEGLRQLAESYASCLEKRTAIPLRDICHTANAGRKHFGSRLAVVGDTAASVRDSLRAFATTGGRQPHEQETPKIAFLYTGQGSQYAGMGRGLFQSSAVFRAAIERCDAHLAGRLGESVVDLLYEDNGDMPGETRFTQPAIFCVGYALTELWRSWGVEPAAVAGHSVGEFAAAVAAGVLIPEDALTLIVERARLMQASPRGAMLAVLGPASIVETALRASGVRAEIAAYNAAENIVVAGEAPHIAELENVFRLAGIRTARLNVSHAFHSHLMDGVLDPLTRAATVLTHRLPGIPFVSNLTGRCASAIEPGYWARHAREPVRFADGIRSLENAGCNVFVEIGPRPVLTELGRQSALGLDLCWLASLRPGRDDWRQMLESAGELYTRGLRIEWSAWSGSRPRRVAGLPGYPFERRRCWLPEDPNAGVAPAGCLPGTRVVSPLPEAQFQAVLEQATFAGHRVNGRTIVPAAAYLEAGLAAARQAGVPVTGLERIELERPLVLTEDCGVLVQTTAGANQSLTVHAFDSAAGEWRRHATATIAVTTSALRGEALQSLRDRVTAPCETGAFYAHCAAGGVQYGADYRLLTALYSGGGEALGHVGGGGSAPSTLDAALLDAVLQTALAALPGGSATSLPLPFSLERFELAAPLRTPFWSHARVGQDPGRRTVTAQLTLYDDAGTVMGGMRGLVLRFPGAGTSAPEKWRDWLCRLEWHAQTLVPETAGSSFGPAARAVNALAAPFIARALAELNGEAVHPRHEQLFRRLLRLRQEGGTDGNAVDPESLIRSVRAAYPEAGPELTLLGRCGTNLAAVLRGARNPLELLFPNGDIADCRALYADSPAFSAMNRLLQRTVSSLVARLRNGRATRILELGGGTGAATEALLPHLDPHATAYTFTDVSSLFSTLTAERLRLYPFVTCRTLDIEKPPASQGFAAGSFDVVVASNVLHATQDLGVSLRHVRELLAPGGALVLLEVTEPQPWIDLVFGLTEGWWRFEDRGTRADYPLLSAEGWRAVLHREGLASVEALQPPDGDSVYGQTVLVASEVAPAKRTWVIAGDAGPAAILARLGETRGERCRLAIAGEDFQSVLQACAADLAGVVYAGGADWERVLALVHAMTAARRPGNPRLWIVTRDAVSVLPGDGVGGVAQSPLWGMGRVIAGEHPELRCRLVDTDGSNESATALWDELLQEGGPEEEVALRSGVRFVSRLATWNPEDDATQFHLPEPVAPEPLFPQAGELEIRVEATGLNFRDVLSATGQYPGGPVPLGVECSGTIVRTGDGVDGWQAGDEVIAIAPGCFGENVIAREDLTVRKPSALSFTDAAGVAVPYLTAAYGLETLAGMRNGDRVLIHAAAGGVGWAACSLAMRAGAAVYATASRSKWEFLRHAGIRNIYDSRSTDFARQILSDTGGEGVDIVLNSLSGEAALLSYSLLRAHGVFVELAKNSPVIGRERCLAFDLLEVAAREPLRIRDLLGRLTGEIGRGELSPLPVTVHARGDIREAFAQMQQARHIGKIVVSGACRDKPRLDERGTYLITGGTGGLGLEISRWLVRNGARRLVLVSRRGPGTEAVEAAAELRRAGATVEFARADAGERAEIAAVVASVRVSGWPLRGVIHAAGVLDDGMIGDQTAERFRTVMKPKADGAWNLHEATTGERLEFFVLFSSVASLAGSQGQANHAAANAFLDSLAAYRRARGLPGMAINWGAWSEIGSAAGDAVERALKVKGLDAMIPAAGIAAFDFLLRRGPVQAAVLPVNWAVFLENQGSAPRFGNMRGRECGTAPRPDRKPGETPDRDLAATLLKTPADQRDAALREELRVMLRKTLGMTPDTTIPARRGFFELGLDSLGSVQMRNSLQKLTGESFSTSLLFDYPNVEALAGRLLQILVKVETPQEPAALSGLEALSGVDALSEEEAERSLLLRLEQIGLS